MSSIDNPRFERHVLLLMALAQFINIWDFMIIMPLGPDLAKALGVDTGHIAWISGSYSISAAIVGVLSARYIDLFDRRSVLLFSLSGLMLATLSMVLAHTLTQLIVVRVITGMFGGPVISSSLAVIADVFPEHRRGEAMGKVFGSFSIASVLGVPLGLEIAQLFGWWAPFIAVSLVAAVTICVVWVQLPPMRGHLISGNKERTALFSSLGHNPAAGLACIYVATSLFAAFMIIPNISAHLQNNMGYPREWLGLLYFTGGSAAFFSMRLAGRQSDRIGYARTCLYATLGLLLALFFGFYAQIHEVPVLLIFVVFMITMSTRNVTSNALISKIPKPNERAGFMSLVSAVQNLMAGAGAACSTLLLSETPDHRLAGMDHVTMISMLAFIGGAWLMFRIEAILTARNALALP